MLPSLTWLTQIGYKTVDEFRYLADLVNLNLERNMRIRTRMIKQLCVMVAACLTFGTAARTFADDPALAANESSVIRVKLDQDGKLNGNAFAQSGEVKTPLAAKVTLAVDGKTMQAVVADESGQFSFADIQPGVYTITAASSKFLGTETIQVEPVSVVDASLEPAAATVDVPMAAVQGDAMIMDMPMGAVGGSCGSSCGGGGGGGVHGGGGGFGRLLPLAGLVGLVGLAGPASPAN